MIGHDAPDAGTDPHIVRPPLKDGPATARGDDNVVDLVRQLAGQGSHLAEQQMALVKAEIRESTQEVKAAIGAMAGAAVVGLAGLAVTLMGVAYLLADLIEHLGLATLIVGIAALVVAYALYASGASKMKSSNLSPDRTQRTLQRTPDAVRGDL